MTLLIHNFRGLNKALSQREVEKLLLKQKFEIVGLVETKNQTCKSYTYSKEAYTTLECCYRCCYLQQKVEVWLLQNITIANVQITHVREQYIARLNWGLLSLHFHSSI